ncbi:hypothetical protein JXB02_05170 [Candidatus Woesearchaeota archaeon]|nr:hypothetical protein [Candidatus Woesearchaeota archaeon]
MRPLILILTLIAILPLAAAVTCEEFGPVGLGTTLEPEIDNIEYEVEFVELAGFRAEFEVEGESTGLLDIGDSFRTADGHLFTLDALDDEDTQALIRFLTVDPEETLLSDTVEDGAALSYTLEGDEHDLEVLGLSETEARFEIDGHQTGGMEEGDEYEFGDNLMLRLTTISWAAPTAEFTLCAAEGYAPDLAVQSFSIEPSSPSVGDEVRISFVIVNQGKATDISPSARVEWDDSGIPGEGWTLEDMRPGAEKGLEYTTIITKPGAYIAQLRLNDRTCSGCREESTLANNYRNRSVEVGYRDAPEGEAFLAARGSYWRFPDGSVFHLQTVLSSSVTFEITTAGHTVQRLFAKGEETRVGDALLRVEEIDTSSASARLIIDPEDTDVEWCVTAADCDDGYRTTIDSCEGNPPRCVHAQITACAGGDGYCPSGCTYDDDTDCARPNACQTASDCDDDDACTFDRCEGDPKECTHQRLAEGCSVGRDCYQVGQVTEGEYCATDLAMAQRKAEGEPCAEGYECESGVCGGDACVRPGFLKRILAWFAGLFGG